MYLISLQISGLEGTENRFIEFGNITSISGRNESGKTTIKNAIIFALTGRINNSNKLDEAVCSKSRAIQVILTYKDNTNSVVVVERNRSVRASTLKINDVAIAQTELDRLFETDHIGLVSAICVGDFMKFDDMEKRHLLLSLTTSINRLPLWKKLTGLDECPLVYNLQNLPVAHRVAKAELNKIDEEISRLTNQKGFIAEEMLKFKTAYEKLEITSTYSHEDFERARKLYNTSLHLQPKLDNYIKLDPGLSLEEKNLEEKIEIGREEVRKIESTKPVNIEFEKSKAQYFVMQEDKAKLEGSNVCPTCLRAYTDTIQKEKRIIQLSEKLDILEKTGVQLKEEHEEQMASWNNTYEIISNRLQNNIQLLENLRSNKSGNIDKAKEEYRQSLGVWEKEHNLIKTKFEAISSTYNGEQTAVIEKDLQERNYADKTNEFDAINKKLKTIDRSKLTKMVNALSPKGIEFEEMAAKIKELNAYLPKGVKLELFEQNKTNDDFKRVFKIFHNDIPYQWLSTGVRMLLDLALAQLITIKLKINFLFIDNTESITSMIPAIAEIQCVIARAIDEDLKCEQIDPKKRKETKPVKKEKAVKKPNPLRKKK